MSARQPRPDLPDAAWLRRSFDRASSTYDAAAVVQAEVRQALLERLDWTRLEPRVVLDVGAATGQAARALKRRYPRARVIAVDSSPKMLRIAARRRSWFRPFALVGADAVQLPLPDASADLAFSNLTLPCCDPDALFAELRRVLAPRGLLTLTGLGPDTLKELRAAWAQVDGHIRVGEFIDMHDLGDALVRAGFAAPVLDVERYTLTYTDVRRLAADLEGNGHAQRRRRAAQGPHLAAQVRRHAGCLRGTSRRRADIGHLRGRVCASLGARGDGPAQGRRAGNPT